MCSERLHNLPEVVVSAGRMVRQSRETPDWLATPSGTKHKVAVGLGNYISRLVRDVALCEEHHLKREDHCTSGTGLSCF